MLKLLVYSLPGHHHLGAKTAKENREIEMLHLREICLRRGTRIKYTGVLDTTQDQARSRFESERNITNQYEMKSELNTI